MAGVAQVKQKEELVRGAIRSLKQDLEEKISLTDILDELISRGHVTQRQNEELIRIEDRQGNTHAMSKLLNMVLGKEVDASGFVQVLRKGKNQVKTSWAYTEVMEGMQRFRTGEWPLPCLKGIQEHLRSKYKRDLRLLEPIPGEDFRVPLEEEAKIMKPQFTAQEVDLENQKNRDAISAFQKLDSDRAVYKNVDISELEGVINSLTNIECKAKNLQSKLINVVGDPGVGKTTAVQRLTWLWAKGKGSLGKYDLVFFVPIRHVKQGTVQEILSDLELLPSELSKEEFQVLETLHKDILFVLDGVDENDVPSELHRLVTGEVFSGSTVLLTARPEAKYLTARPESTYQTLSLLPRVKVALSGTDEDTAERYIKAAVSPSSDEEWNRFQANYQEKLSDTSLLCIPLYLTLLCGVFRAHIASGLKCVNLKVPESTTDLFNALLHVILRRWIARVSGNRRPGKSEDVNITFIKGPLNQDSTIPSHLKRVLYFMGKLCYNSLTQTPPQYEFTDVQLGDYLLDIQDVKDSGLFTVGKSGDHEVCFLKHKQFQEYLAALYLSYEGTKEPHFHDILYQEQNKGRCLALVMRDSRLIKLVEFACGLSAQFLRALLEAAASQFCVMRNKCGQVDVYYEAALFTEHHSDLSTVNVTSLVGFTELKRLLCKSGTKQVSNDEFYFLIGGRKKPTLGFYSKCLQKLTPLFDKDLSVELMSSLYVTSGESSDCRLLTQILSIDDLHTVGQSTPFQEGQSNPLPGCESNKRKLLVEAISSKRAKTDISLESESESEDERHLVYRPHTGQMSPLVSESQKVCTGSQSTSDTGSQSTSNTGNQSTSNTESELILHLDQLQMELLGGVRVLGVESLQCGCVSPRYVDLPALLGTFPHLKQLDVTGYPYIPNCSHVRSDRQMCTSLTRVRLHSSSSSPTSLPESHVTCLLQQAALTQLELFTVSILPALGALTEAGQSLWPHLKVLNMTDDLSELPESAVRGLTRLLESQGDTLEECDLNVEGVERHSVPHLEQALCSLRRVHTLMLRIRLPDYSYHTGEVLQHVLPHLTTLNTLFVLYHQLEDTITGVVDAVCSHGTIHTLRLDCGLDELPTHLRESLESRGVEVEYTHF